MLFFGGNCIQTNDPAACDLCIFLSAKIIAGSKGLGEA